MRPVNLLPAKHRARTGGADGSKASYISLGALGALVLAVLLYVLSANQVSSKNAELEQVRQKIQAAESQAVTLGSYGAFSGTKEARVAAVKALATTRLDWERLFRELAHVLPERVWLTSFSGNSAATGAATGTGSEAPSGPLVNLEGCAASHSGVADVMIRLRELHGAEDVALTESAKAVAGGAEAGDTTSSDSAATGGAGCGPYNSFNIDVTLSDAAAAVPSVDGGPSEVPARLGGGE